MCVLTQLLCTKLWKICNSLYINWCRATDREYYIS